MFHVVLGQSGPKWQPGKPLEEQTGWDEHAVFMDGLVEEGFILLGGPIPGGHVVHVVDAESEEDVRAMFARDPWARTHLVVESVDAWTVRLDALGVLDARRRH